MTTRCKFRCETVTLAKDTAVINLVPVTSGSPENEKFFRYTPGGEVKLSVVDRKTADAFVPGKEYFVDITAAE